MPSSYKVAQKILTREQFARLSPRATRLYAVIWNRLRKGRVDSYRWYDANLAVRAQMLQADLPRTRAELVEAGLIHIQPDDDENDHAVVHASVYALTPLANITSQTVLMKARQPKALRTFQDIYSLKRN